MPRKGRYRKKNRTHVKENAAQQQQQHQQQDGSSNNPQNALVSDKTKIPKSLVIRRGKADHSVHELVEDLRQLMMPYTAVNFQQDNRKKSLTLAKYCQELALPMGITHILAFSQNDDRLNLRLARTPEGPTLTFRVTQFSLTKSIKALQRRPINANAKGITQHPPIVVTNNFGDSTAPPQIKLLRITFQNMFPAINVATVRLADCRRVVLFHLLEEEEVEEEEETKDNKNDKTTTKTTTTIKQRIQIRHYAIKAAPVGVNKKVRRLVQSKLPNLNKVQDIADYISGQAAGAASVGDASDSEPEDDPAHRVVLAQSYTGKGNRKSQTSALKLVELGPRLSLELFKVEKGLGAGDVMYHAHAHLQKSPLQAKELKERKERERQLKQSRRLEQQANVERKRQALEDKRNAKKQRKEERQEAALEALRQGGGGGGAMVESEDDDDNDEGVGEGSGEEEEEEE